MNFSEYYTSRVEKLINEQKAAQENKIFVLTDFNIIKEDSFIINLCADSETVKKNAGAEVFNRDWFTNVFTVLNTPKEGHVLSTAQFTYLVNYIDRSFFQDRVVVIRDNLRQLFPITEEEFTEQAEDENIESRPENLPIYQAEQYKIHNQYYYSLKALSLDFETIEIFSEKEALIESTGDKGIVLDVESDQYEVDVFLNDCIRNEQLNKQVVVKLNSKNPNARLVRERLEQLNAILKVFGGGVLWESEGVIKKEFTPKDSTQTMLKTHWGDKAEFRHLKVYNNPDLNNEIVEISQGLIVETIINEYENAKEGNNVRDLFLTAPTGAGKSLLFQLPAFHVAKEGDVTIVVSPLIALMKDQVRGIVNDRKFQKVAYLNSELSLIDRETVLNKCHDGEIDILYMSPELLLSYNISYFLGERKLGLLVVDEAHLITTWGRDFRVDYWFLGNHIKKIRKYSDYSFPMVAVTATAVYGGSNDMVFDGVRSLAMNNEHLFIGQVKRNDIEFAVNNYEEFNSNYRKNKIKQTVDFIKQVDQLGVKTLVYTPYSKHVNQILDSLRAEGCNAATGYYGGLPSDQKQLAFNQFHNNERKVMISTKAFGMGVDISDIELVYHHAPSGLLPDYVQEIGRVARDPRVHGTAALNYSTKDQQFSKALHGMSALRQHQLREVLKKVYKLYLKSNKSRNLLMSVDDFGHIFEDAMDIDQKVLTALMMIEKDYLSKYRFNVLIARPKKLFVKVYAKLSGSDFPIFNNKFSNATKVLTTRSNGDKIVELDLDKIWSEHYSNIGFPSLKYEFYAEKLFIKLGVSVIPQLSISYEISQTYLSAFESLQTLFDNLRQVFSSFGGSFFTKDELTEKLKPYFKTEQEANKIAKFVLSTYSGRQIAPGKIEPNSFLQQKRVLQGYEYRIFDNNYGVNFSTLLRRFKNLFEQSEDQSAKRYVSNKDSVNLTNYIRLGYFLELLDLGTNETKGGDKPMIFVRLNDPLRIERDSNNDRYRNSLLTKTLERHHLSNQIFDHFFLNSFTNEERWDFIEEFFLGEDVDPLIEKYKGSKSSKQNIIEIIKEIKKKQPILETKKVLSDNNTHVFSPRENEYYKPDALLTLEINEELVTYKISQWLSKNPVELHKAITKHKIALDSKMFEILVSKLKKNHSEYFKKSIGLKMRIKMKGYSTPVQAIVPYKNKPVEFYKWWIENQDQVYLKKIDLIQLVDIVKSRSPQVLKSAHANL